MEDPRWCFSVVQAHQSHLEESHWVILPFPPYVCWRSPLSFFWWDCPDLDLLQVYAGAGLSLLSYIAPKTKSKRNRAFAAPVGKGLYGIPWDVGVLVEDAQGKTSYEHLHLCAMLVHALETPRAHLIQIGDELDPSFSLTCKK